MLCSRWRDCAVVLVTLAVFAVASVDPARAQQTGGNTVNWLGDEGGWQDATRWAGGATPDATQRAGIDGGFDHPSIVHFPAVPGPAGTAPSATIGVAGVDIYPGDTLVLHAGTLAASGIVQSMDGTLVLHDGATLTTQQHFWSLNGGTLRIDGGGRLDVSQQLFLGSDFDTLEVWPRADGLPYDKYVIATYGSLVGTFRAVTEGIALDYNTPGQIRISGAPAPEPDGAVLLAAGAAGVLRRSRWRGTARGRGHRATV